MLTELAIAFLYGQVINIFETLVWVKGFWKLEDIDEMWGDERRIPRDAYHAVLALAYIIPFLPLGIYRALLCGLVVSLVNDLLWHFWSVKPRNWIKWLKKYFNPYDNETLLWYARFAVAVVKVTPSRMFKSVIVRVFIMGFLIFWGTLG